LEPILRRLINARWKLFWLIFAFTLLVYLAMILWTLPTISAMAEGAPAFDLRPGGYSFEEAKSFLVALGSEGRDFYLNFQLSLDTAYPALVAITVVSALIGLDRGGWGWVFCVFSIAGTIFDYLENIAVRGMLQAGPLTLTPEMVEQASGWTLLKSISHTIAFTGLLILGMMALYGWTKTKFSADRHSKAAIETPTETEQ
jgi:hypothetical protein